MASTPKLSQIGSSTLRRLAWFRTKSMTRTLEALLELTDKMMLTSADQHEVSITFARESDQNHIEKL